MSKALIVDDVEENLCYLQTLLTADGFQVELAHNGEEALSLARTAPPDLIISDILMPVMDGFALCHTLHTDPQLAGIPFVIYTATYTGPKDEALALQAGADLFLIKPLEPREFLQAIYQVMHDAESGSLPRHKVSSEPPEEFLRNYNAALVRKLEDKLTELEVSNRRLAEDIKQHKQALEALAQSEERFSKAFRSNPLPMVIAKVTGGVVDANDAMLQKVGFTLEEVLGRTADDLGLSVEPAAKIREDFRKVHYKARNRVTQYKNRSGQILTFLISTELIHLAGEPHILGMAVDITEQKRQEDLMRMLSSAVTTASDAIIITDARLDPTPIVLYANPAFTHLTGYTSEEVIGRRTSDTFGPPMDSNRVEEIRQALLTRHSFHGEVTNYTKDGRLLYVELDIVPVRGSSGEITHFIAVRRDISRRKAEELNRQRLFRLVFEAQAEERRRISRELHDHAGQLLTSMLLRLNVLQGRTKDQAVKKAVQEISSVASNTLEDISRLARGLHPAVLEDLGLVEALRRAVEEFGAGGVSANFQVIGEMERLPQHVEREVYQIVKEALTNVQKHSRADHVKVFLEQSENFVRARIQDNGVGFDTLDPAAGSPHLGIIGMKERATMLGGSLALSSSPKQGTTVTLTIPLMKAEEATYHEPS
jgi:PAS domain S-box-containing protein